jgi:hypothetical protein
MAEDTFFRSYLMLSRQLRVWIYVCVGVTSVCVASWPDIMRIVLALEG